MSFCSRCRLHYRELPDEQGDHACPNCGRLPHERRELAEDENEEEEE